MFDEIDEADFIGVERKVKAAPATADVAMVCFSLRGGVKRVSVKIAPHVLAEIDGPVRLKVRWHAAKRLLLLTHDNHHGIELASSARSKRQMLRFAPPEGFHVFDGEIAPEFYVDRTGKRLLIECPKPPPPPPPPPPTQREMIENARRAVPAPQFGRGS